MDMNWPHNPKGCQVVDRVVEPCKGLDAVMEPFGGPTSKGVQTMTLTNFKTNTYRSFVILRGGKHRKTGIVLNICPFCGNDISHHLEARKAEAEDAALQKASQP
jgi:hypothetical protein